MTFSRRTFLKGTAGLAGSTALTSAMGGMAFGQDKHRIRHFWWGNPERDKRTFEVIEIFNGAHPDIEVVGETLGFADYFTKLTTQIAGRNMPDVIQQGYGVMLEYVGKGALLPLDEYVGKTLDIAKIDQSAIDAGTFDGKFYGLSIGANAMVSLYNTRMFEEAKIETDPITWTYDDLKTISVAISEATPDGIYGTDDCTADWGAFGVYLGQKGISPQYTAEGQFNFDQSVIEEYWNLWKDIRDAGGTPPGGDSAGLVAPELNQLGIVTGTTAISYAWSNQMVGTQALMQDKIGAGMRPRIAGSKSGQSIQPSQFVCLTRDTIDADATVQYMNAFVNDPEMTAVLGLERGIPSQSDVRAALQPNLTEIEATSVAYFDAIQPHVTPLDPAPPPGNRECEEAFERIAVAVLLDQQSIADTAAQFMQEAEAILKRAQ